MNWPEMRADVERARREFQLSLAEFSPVSALDWQRLEERIYQEFCILNHPTARPLWLWEHFKKPAAHVLLVDWSTRIAAIQQLLGESQKAWLLIAGEHDKFWFYDCEVGAGLRVLGEISGLDEYYFIDKKYHWLIGVNHHAVLFATGSPMAERLAAAFPTARM